MNSVIRISCLPISPLEMQCHHPLNGKFKRSFLCSNANLFSSSDPITGEAYRRDQSLQ